MSAAGLALARPVATFSPSIARVALGAIVVIGLALRIVCARGGLWLDEAWSVLLAHEVGTPAGVLFGINHDNNHHLNSLWLLAVGMDAPPIAQRALSVASGTLAIPLAAALARRAGTGAALVTAALFAVSPLLVTLGSEARGYAPMLAALLGAALIVDRALAGEPGGERRALLAILVVIGMLAQLTMAFGMAALAGWALLDGREREGAVRRTAWLFGPAIAAGAGTLLVLTLAAWASPTGFHFGSYERFTWLTWLRAVVEMLGYAVGFPVLSVALPAAALALLVLAPRLGASRPWFYRLAILGFPAGLALIHAANPGHARYYLVAGTALLLLIGEAIGNGLSRTGPARLPFAAAVAAIVAGSLAQDVELARNRRGDPAAAVAALADRAPTGAVVAFDRQSGEGVIRVAAAEAHYPLAIANCAPFVFVDRFGGEAMPTRVTRCGAPYRRIAAARTTGLSGTHWTLYQRRP